MSTLDDFAASNVALLVKPSDRYTVVAVSQTQEEGRGGTLYDVADISFTVTGRSGVFTVQIPLASWPVFEFGIDLTSEADIIEQLYSL